MKKISQLIMRTLLRDPAWVMVTAVFFGIINYFCFKNQLRTCTPPDMGAFYELRIVLQMALYCYIYFAFTSFYFQGKVRHESAGLLFQAMPRAYEKVMWIQLIINFMSAIVVVANLLAYVIYSGFYTSIEWTPAFWEMVGETIFYIGGSCVCGILAGAVCATYIRRIPGIVVLCVWCALGSPLIQYVVEAMYYCFDVNLFRGFEFLCVFPRNLKTRPNYLSGYPISIDRVVSMVFWVAAPIALLFLKHTRARRGYVRVAIMSLAMIACISVYCMPMERTVSDRNPEAPYCEDVFYYITGEGKDAARCEIAEFHVDEYDLKLAIGLELGVEAKLHLDVTSLAAYHFTLYHGYKIASIIDQEGRALPFSQEGDYITIENKYGDAESITMKYAGNNATFYAGVNGVVLPGFFPYYPQSGFSPVYDTLTQGYIPNLLSVPAYFDVEISGQQIFYCNLKETESGRFCGTADGVSVMGGLLTESLCGETRLIYPYADVEQFGENRGHNDVKNFLNTKNDQYIVNTIMVLPIMNCRNIECVCFSDGTITCVQPRTLSLYYESARLQIKKRALQTLWRSYLDGEDFANRLEYENLVYSETIKGEAQLLMEIINRYGEEVVSKEIDYYLYDNGDARDTRMFLEDLYNESDFYQ